MKSSHHWTGFLWAVFLILIQDVDTVVGSSPIFQLRSTSTNQPVQWQITGPVDNAGFYVQASTNLTNWAPIHWDRLGPGGCGFADIEAPSFGHRFYRAILKESPIQVIAGFTDLAGPFSLLHLSGSGFDSTNSLSVRFFDARGFSAELPVVEATPTRLTVPVPVYINPRTGVIGSNAVSWQIVSRSAGETSLSRTFSGLQIGFLPTLSVAPGSVVSSFLKATVKSATNHLLNLTGSPWDTPAVKGAISNQVDALTSLISQLQRLMANPSQSFSLGSISGQDLIVDQNHLAVVDRMLVGWLLAQTGDDAATLAPAGWGRQQNIARTEATAYAQAAIQGSGDLDGHATTFVNAQQRVLSGTPDAIKTALQVAGGAGAVGIGLVLLFAPAEVALAAVALPTVALLYITIESGGGMIALGGALGQTTDTARELVKDGVENLEELSYGAVKVVLPQTAGAVAAIGLGAKALKEAFTSAVISGGSESEGEIYTGTATYRESQTFPQSPGWTPNPCTVTTTATYPVTLRVSASLQSSGTFTGTLTEFAHDRKVMFPQMSFTYPDGQMTVVPAKTDTIREEQWETNFTGTDDAAHPVIRINPDEAWDDSYTISATLTSQPVTGVVTLILQYEGVMTVGDTTIRDTIEYTLTRR